MSLRPLLVDRPRHDRRVANVDEILLGEPLQQLRRIAGALGGVELPNSQCCAHRHLHLRMCAPAGTDDRTDQRDESSPLKGEEPASSQASTCVAVTHVAAPTTIASNKPTRLNPTTARTITAN